MNKPHYKTDCIGQCHRLSGTCTGCGRTADEIFDWIILSDEQKRAILATERDPSPRSEKKGK